MVAGGSSSRMGGYDKLFHPLAGKTALAWVIDVFQNCPLVQLIVLVLSRENMSRGEEMIARAGWSKVYRPVPGGPRRQDSVWEGLKNLHGCDIAVIHDGARPCITADLIERGVAEALTSGAAIAAVPLTDTIKRINAENEVEHTVEREGLWVVQTPQVYKIDIIKNAFRKIKRDVTDEANLVELSGHKVKVFPGSNRNIKITSREDLAIAEAILQQQHNSF
ncbi:2-C-methyl-D-erythritol 4-phosphate cytidylyltransferase [Chloroflexota bacterium]